VGYENEKRCDLRRQQMMERVGAAVSKMTSHCAGTVQVREESECGV